MGKNVDKASSEKLKELENLLNERNGSNSISLEDFLNNPNEADWNSFKQVFGEDNLDILKSMFPEYFKEAKSDESQLDENGQKKKSGGSCSGNSSQKDQSSDNANKDNQDKDQDEDNQDKQDEENDED